MNPTFIDTAHWQILTDAIYHFFLWVVFVVLGAGGALVSIALVRSLMVSGELHPKRDPNDRFLTAVLRPVGLILFPIGFVLAFWQLSQAIGLAIVFINDYFPRYLI